MLADLLECWEVCKARGCERRGNGLSQEMARCLQGSKTSHGGDDDDHKDDDGDDDHNDEDDEYGKDGEDDENDNGDDDFGNGLSQEMVLHVSTTQSHRISYSSLPCKSTSLMQ